MGNVSAQLSRTLRTGTAHEGTILVTLYLRTANRAIGWQMVRYRIFRTLGKIHFQNFRNDFTGLADFHRVANTNVTLRDEILIVKGCVGNGGTCQTNRANHCLGGQHTGTAHLDDDIFHHRVLDFRGILVGHCPLGELGSSTHPTTLIQVINLDDSTVDVTGQFFTIFIDGHDIVINFLNIVQLFVGNYLKFQTFQVVQRFGMGSKFHTFCQLYIENQNIQATLGSNFGVQLTQRTSCRISGIGKEGLTLLFLFLIQLLKALLGHIHLAPDDQSGRSVFDGHGNGSNGFQILRHILAHIAVTTGSTTDKLAIHVFQCYGKAIYLGFHRELRCRIYKECFFQEFVQFFQ